MSSSPWQPPLFTFTNTNRGVADSSSICGCTRELSMPLVLLKGAICPKLIYNLASYNNIIGKIEKCALSIKRTNKNEPVCGVAKDMWGICPLQKQLPVKEHMLELRYRYYYKAAPTRHTRNKLHRLLTIYSLFKRNCKNIHRFRFPWVWDELARREF